MKKINLLYIVSNLKRCGPINILYNLLKYLDKEKYEVYIVSLSPECENTRKEEFENLGCKIYNLNLGKIKGYLIAYFHIRILKKIDSIAACSKSVKLMLLDKKVNFDYVQNGVDDEIFIATNNEEKIRLRKKLNLPIDKKIFIVVGNLDYRKNVTMIIESFNKRNNENEILLFIGYGKLYNKSINLSKYNQNIIFKGQVDNVGTYLRLSDYYISASLAEGLPNSVLEAMSTGLPCILSNIKPHEEIINNYNQLFNLKDINSLSKCMDKVINIAYQYLKKESRSTIENYLSSKKGLKNMSLSINH